MPFPLKFKRDIILRIAILWTLAIVVFSFLPGEAKVALGTETESTIPAVQKRVVIVHRTGHLIGFGVASLLFTIGGANNLKRFIFVLIVSALGVAIEWLQHSMFSSTFEWWDVRDDLKAIITAYMLGLLVVRFLQADTRNLG